jgi:hypothetical protein
VLVGDVVERHLLRLHQIAQAHFARLEAGFRRDQIEHQFQRETDAGPGYAAIRQDRALVGRDRKRPAAIGRHQIRPRQDAGDLRRLKARRERIGRVSAGIDGGFAIDAPQPAVAVGIDGDLVVMLAAVRAGREMLATILGPAHRMAAMHREPGKADFFRQQNSFMPEAAADVGRNDTDSALLHAEAFGKAAEE